MPDLSWSHIIIVMVVALVVVGPKDLPKLMRALGRWVARARTMAEQFRKNFDDMARQTELEELRAQVDALKNERPLAGEETAANRILDPGADADVAEAEQAPRDGKP